MSSPDADYIQHRLLKFEFCIDETISHFPELAPSGPWPASAPYREKCAIRALLNTPPSEAPEDTLMQEYTRINRKLEVFREKNGNVFRSHLYSDLRHYTHVYHAAVCHAQCGPVGEDTYQDLSLRELIQELCRELTGYYDLSGIVALLTMLDKNLPENVAYLSQAREYTRAEPVLARTSSSAGYPRILTPESSDSIRP